MQITVISPEDPVNTEGIDFITVSPSKYDLLHGGWYSLSYAYAEVIKTINADLIHFTDARESYAYKGHIPTIGTLHDDYFARHNWNPVYYKYDYVDWIKRWLYYSFVLLSFAYEEKLIIDVLSFSTYSTFRPFRLFPDFPVIIWLLEGPRHQQQ